jgi:hypothetical protein
LRPDDTRAQEAVTRVEKAWEDARVQQMLIAHPTSGAALP